MYLVWCVELGQRSKDQAKVTGKINSLCMCSQGHHFPRNSSDSKDKRFFNTEMTVAVLSPTLESSGNSFPSDVAISFNMQP